MFVKQAYQKRLKKQEQEINSLIHTKQTRNPVIGSIRNDKINYDRQQQFFSKDDVPQHARTIKEQIKTLIDPDNLGLRKKPWNTSVSVPKNMQRQQTHEQKLLKIKLGFLDHPLPKYKEPNIYPGVDTRNDYTGWNVSNQVLSKQMKQNHMKTTMSAFENSKARQNMLLTNYINPLSRTSNFIETYKKQQEVKAQFLKELREKYIFDNPNASQEKINGAIFRLAYESQVKQKRDDIEALAMKTDFKASMSMTQKNRLKAISRHTGIWQQFKNTPGQQQQFYWAWSCCMNEDQKSSGCATKIKDGNRWNFSSYNNS